MIRSGDMRFCERIVANEMNGGFMRRHCKRSQAIRARDQDRIASSLCSSQ
jgi:hypothetical protein